MITRTALALSLLVLTSCGGVGAMVSPTHTYTTSDSLVLKRPATNFVVNVSDVGKSLGYDVAGIEGNTVDLADDNSVGMGALIGKIGYKHVKLTLEPGGHAIKIDLMVTGNFDDATQEAATERLAKLKAALAARFH